MADKPTEKVGKEIGKKGWRKFLTEELPSELGAQGLVAAGKAAIHETATASTAKRLSAIEKASMVRPHAEFLFVTEGRWPNLERRISAPIGRFSDQAVERAIYAATYEFISSKTNVEVKESVTDVDHPKIMQFFDAIEKRAAGNDAVWEGCIDRLTDGFGMTSETTRAITHFFEEPPPAPLTDAVNRLTARGQQLRNRRGIFRRLL